MKRYFITGAAGFVGRHIISKLLENENVFVIATDITELDWSHERLQFIKTDINSHLSGIAADILIHLVGSRGVWSSEKNPDSDYQINVASLDSALNAMEKNSLKKVLLSSSWQVYGDNEKTEGGRCQLL